MANNIVQVKRTSVAGRTPNTTNSGNTQYINAGEMALNMPDGILYTSNGTALITVGANVVNQNVTGNLTVKAIIANGSIGTSGQVLTTNSTGVYWSSSGGTGTVTSVATGNGMTGGPITTTGTVSILANTGIVANSTGTFVNAAYIATIAANSATFANSSVTNTFTVGTASYFVANGNLGVGTSSPGYKLEVNGSFAATTKSFIINHPTKPGMKLRYGSLESPYHGVRLTGEFVIKTNKVVVDLPNYIYGLCKQEGAQVQITNIKHDKVIWVNEIDIENNRFIVCVNRKKIDKKEYGFYWSFTAIRKDIEDMSVEFKND